MWVSYRGGGVIQDRAGFLDGKLQIIMILDNQVEKSDVFATINSLLGTTTLRRAHARDSDATIGLVTNQTLWMPEP